MRDLDDFLSFLAGREERYELVDGRLLAMAGATLRQDDIRANLLAAPPTRGCAAALAGSRGPTRWCGPTEPASGAGFPT